MDQVKNQQSPQLCNHCHQLNNDPHFNFDCLATKELPRSHKITVTLGSLEDIISRRQCCSFCSLVIDAISTAWGQTLPTTKDGKQIICRLYNRVVGVIRQPGRGLGYTENFGSNEYQYSNCRLVVECVAWPDDRLAEVEIQTVDNESNVRGLFDGDAQLFTRRPCESMKAVDFVLLRSWLGHCREAHAYDMECQPVQVSGSDEDGYLEYFRVIDVTDKRVVKTNGVGDYVALSYVWGQALQLQLTSSTKDRLFGNGGLDAEDVPKTIQDAMHVVEKLGMRYIWVDALCIVQDDIEEKSCVIGAMDHIYSRAALTIVAASGSSADSGLAGIKVNTRDLESFERKTKLPGSSREFIVARSSPLGLMQKSVWNTRGWTYQERLCSRRMLVFTREQVAYVCGTSCWCEDTVLETANPLVHYEDKPLLGLNLANSWTNSFMKKVEEAVNTSPFQRYASMVDEYTARNLSFPEDVANAFTGGLKRFQHLCQKSGIPTCFVFGLPTAWLELALIWNHAGSRAWKRRTVKWRYAPGVELAFPSWSWMGWMGATNTQSCLEILEPGVRPEVNWYYVEPRQQSIRPLVSGASTKTQSPWFRTSDAERVLRRRWKLEGAQSTVTEQDIASLGLSSVDCSGKLLFYTSVCFLPLTAEEDLGRQTFRIGSGRSQIEVDHDWAKGRLGDMFEFIVLGRRMDNDDNDPGKLDSLLVMLVQREATIAYRVAVGAVAEADWVAAEPRWQLVVLG
ncbi:hypothetical protein XA68_12347 [Ophiocordyceps unilateralis]|uniref:Heterokaryon incompatibility domain-containing protein n=1 Tax=Ophiocordyceps unilateralis TaxID=268505 RepID=A0A2A9PUU8_OPHUN|nr:hypothetical protein XA68_12347 [Ophiocordyceps unilateralis]